MATSSRSTWNVGLDAWIIQDGNYPDFAVGEIVEFAVEFYQAPGTAIEVCSSDAFAKPVNRASYDVVAEKVLVSDQLTVLDIGILVYQEGVSQFLMVEGSGRVRTQLELGVDPYMYLERLSKDDQIPALVYSWRILSILRQTAPFIEVTSDCDFGSKGKVMTRDLSKLGYEEIARTDAWRDDEGLGEYILHCDLLPVPAKRISGTST